MSFSRPLVPLCSYNWFTVLFFWRDFGRLPTIDDERKEVNLAMYFYLIERNFIRSIKGRKQNFP